ncbi:hypothetical protein [Paraburkholderia antibiotica]|uniref:Uncharacterized protein n=1 Tax=Paraburkholderia antibiotica TaxID=2728839 RepID=A0A7Y0A123_9BURK|nr:hypothetical protein [Paraburkholderia antibiotica]NML34522.1 hypothetical protein [Paraburkholderia antibiotica]
MTVRTPIVLIDGNHAPLSSGDTLSASLIQLSSDAGNKLEIGSDGGLSASMDAPSLPSLTIELGHTSQANGGLGIDMGTYYQLDFQYGVTVKNQFNYTLNGDGTINIPAGVYLVVGTFNLTSQDADTYDTPPQMIVSTGQRYAFPGIYQYAVRSYPSPKVGAAASPVGNVLGSVTMSGAMPLWSNDQALWLGFSKVLGSANGKPLHTQGFLSYLKIG